MSIIRLHRLTAIVIILFALLHFATHLSGIWGIATYNETQALFRLIYRTPFVEPIILGAFMLQMWLGGWLIWRNRTRLWRTVWGRVQTISGVVFIFFLGQHLFSYALARWIDGLNTNMYWPLSVVSGPPFVYYFVVYYFLGVASFSIHLACALRLIAIRKSRKQLAMFLFWGTTVVGVIMAVTIDLILLQTAASTNLPQEWINALQRYVPNFSPWK